MALTFLGILGNASTPEMSSEEYHEYLNKEVLDTIHNTPEDELSDMEYFAKLFIEEYGIEEFWMFVDTYNKYYNEGNDIKVVIGESAAGTRVLAEEPQAEAPEMPLFEPSALCYMTFSRADIEAMHPGRNAITIEYPGKYLEVLLLDKEEMLAVLDEPEDPAWTAEYEAMRAVDAPLIAKNIDDGTFMDAAALPAEEEMDLTPYFILIVAVAAALIVVGTLLIRRKRRMAPGTDEKRPAEKN